MKKGIYFCGDPCYVIKDSKWGKFCDLSWKHDNEEFEFEGYTVFASGTKYGDDVYTGSDDNGYAVDSGTLGCIPIELCKAKGLDFSNPQCVKYKHSGSVLGYIYDFEEDFECSEVGGKFEFGDKLSIDTDPPDDECDCNCCIH
jgi:hypothetical protein